MKGLRAYHVTVTVSWPNGDRERRVELTTVRLVNEGKRS